MNQTKIKKRLKKKNTRLLPYHTINLDSASEAGNMKLFDKNSGSRGPPPASSRGSQFISEDPLHGGVRGG